MRVVTSDRRVFVRTEYDEGGFGDVSVGAYGGAGEVE